MRLIGTLLVAIGLAVNACAPAYNSMSAPEVAQMSDADLCIARLSTAAGFVPMEIIKRGVSCDDRKPEMVERMIALENESFLQRFRVDQIQAVLPYRCEGIDVRVESTPNRVVHFRNKTAKTQYFYLLLHHREIDFTEYVIGKLIPRGQHELAIPNRFKTPEWRQNSGCYAK